MTVVSHMLMQLRPGQRELALAAFVDRKVFQECAVSIPGFQKGHLLTSPDNPDSATVIAHWDQAQSFRDWITHPARHQQEKDLSHFLAAPPVTHLFSEHFSHDVRDHQK